MRKIYLFFVMLIATTSAVTAQSLEKVFEGNKDFEQVSSIKVNGDFCKVEFVKGDKVNVTAELSANKQLDGYAVSMDLAAGVLTVNVNKPESGWSSHSGFVTVTMPDGMNLEVVTSSGYINLADFKNTNLKAESKSGKIVVINLQGSADLSTKSATITVDNITGEVATSTKDGNQTVTNVKGNAKVVAYNGSLIIENIEGACSAETTDGALTLKNIKGQMRMKTNSGSMKLSDSEGTITTTSGAGSLNFFNVQGVFDINSGKGDVIGARVKFTESSSIKTTEGKIKFKLENSKEELSFACVSEKGMMVVYGKAKKKKVNEGKGSIVITTYSTTGAQNYY
ncbi:DUF4097 family beta strand repeat-containing protein [Carboxylicivirga caseinilyticus]|uniref:DUF4097 family beta strand repeat-containing protein n=1 Tax=Carboxylicivirga caseinilyticus TaxID=3417572 RepID=UPI003D34506D|nr:hypothetical protein [Marinilabiliaceae bacterium A049]